MSSDQDKLTIAEETAYAEKQDVVTGRVRITTRTETKDELLEALLAREEVSVERVAVERDVDVVPDVRTEGDVTIVPLVEEVLVVEKRLRLREELHIRRTVSQDPVEVPVTLRKQRAEIHRDGPNQNNEEEI